MASCREKKGENKRHRATKNFKPLCFRSHKLASKTSEQKGKDDFCGVQHVCQECLQIPTVIQEREREVGEEEKKNSYKENDQTKGCEPYLYTIYTIYTRGDGLGHLQVNVCVCVLCTTVFPLCYIYSELGELCRFIQSRVWNKLLRFYKHNERQMFCGGQINQTEPKILLLLVVILNKITNLCWGLNPCDHVDQESVWHCCILRPLISRHLQIYVGEFGRVLADIVIKLLLWQSSTSFSLSLSLSPIFLFQMLPCIWKCFKKVWYAKEESRKGI